MPSVFIHVPSPFFFKWSAASERRRWGRGIEREREAEGERVEVFSNRNEVSWSRLFSRAEAVTAQFKTFCHAKQPKAPQTCNMTLLWTSGSSFSSRSDFLKLWENVKKKSVLINRSRDWKFFTFICGRRIRSGISFFFVNKDHCLAYWQATRSEFVITANMHFNDTHVHTHVHTSSCAHTVLIFLRTAAGVWKPWENGLWNQANQLPL